MFCLFPFWPEKTELGELWFLLLSYLKENSLNVFSFKQKVLTKQEEVLNYAAATVLTLLFHTYMVFRLQFHAHVLFLPESFPWWAIWIVTARWCDSTQSEAGVLQINLNQILFDLLQYQRTISELMVLLPVDPIRSWQPPLVLNMYIGGFPTSFCSCLCSPSFLHPYFSVMIWGVHWKLGVFWGWYILIIIIRFSILD